MTHAQTVNLQDDFDLALGRAVKAQMALAGATGEDVAELVGLTPSALSARLNGHTPFKANELARIALVVRCSAADFYEPSSPEGRGRRRWGVVGREGIEPSTSGFTSLRRRSLRTALAS